ncbi:hypothetical protein [Luteibacter yeojuensis]|uniref:Lipoprotein n=1 Tax=Luteibacter yeojuensis TaxID=345309 RepID=A0A7X5QRJ5_9GAMM|nr:hypothetical protein [Luteibacter yeojuensis]NID14039.1 hypothetical protein [Luteibacter yeojuensis]
MRSIAIFALAGTLTMISACSQETWHLVSGKKGDAAEIRIDGDEGVANWSWGPDNFTVEVTVVKNGLAHETDASKQGDLVLELADGTHLEFSGPRTALVCQRGCESLHLPNAWLVSRD